MRNQQFPMSWFVRLPVTTMEDVRRCLAMWSITLGIGFHPDTRGVDYIDDNNQRSFTENQAKKYDLSIRQCFDVCNKNGVDLYALALRIHQTVLNLDVIPNIRKQSMNLQEIKSAVESGKKVHWANKAYNVVKDDLGQFLITCPSTGGCWGLTHKDGTTLNGKESEFFVED